MKKEEYIEYPTGHSNWDKILISEIKEKDKRECWDCKWQKIKPNIDWIPIKCSTCEWRWWVYKEQEWEF